MNEQILKLVEQVAIGKADFDKGSYYVATPDKMQKFAELIVQECGRVADQWVNDEDNGTNLVSDKLKQHFGVKGD